MPPCPTSIVTQSTPSGFMPGVVSLVKPVFPEWFFYLQEVLNIYHTYEYTCYVLCHSIYCSLHHCTTPAPPTPTGIISQFTNASSVRVAWQWTSSGCFNATTVTYHPEGGGESSLQLSDPAATEATFTDFQCNIDYTITVVVTAGGHRRERTAFFPVQGKAQHL